MIIIKAINPAAEEAALEISKAILRNGYSKTEFRARRDMTNSKIYKLLKGEVNIDDGLAEDLYKVVGIDPNTWTKIAKKYEAHGRISA
jgi:plasmid maintenance system antidote protein VapI